MVTLFGNMTCDATDLKSRSIVAIVPKTSAHTIEPAWPRPLGGGAWDWKIVSGFLCWGRVTLLAIGWGDRKIQYVLCEPAKELQPLKDSRNPPWRNTNHHWIILKTNTPKNIKYLVFISNCVTTRCKKINISLHFRQIIFHAKITFLLGLQLQLIIPHHPCFRSSGDTRDKICADVSHPIIYDWTLSVMEATSNEKKELILSAPWDKIGINHSWTTIFRGDMLGYWTMFKNEQIQPKTTNPTKTCRF